MKIENLKIDSELPLPYELASRGTHVLVLPSDDYLKKYHNKIGYLEITFDGFFILKDASLYGNSKEQRLSQSWCYAPIFHHNAIEGIHFKWIENSNIYDRFGKKIN